MATYLTNLQVAHSNNLQVTTYSINRVTLALQIKPKIDSLLTYQPMSQANNHQPTPIHPPLTYWPRPNPRPSSTVHPPTTSSPNCQPNPNPSSPNQPNPSSRQPSTPKTICSRTSLGTRLMCLLITSTRPITIRMRIWRMGMINCRRNRRWVGIPGCPMLTFSISRLMSCLGRMLLSLRLLMMTSLFRMLGLALRSIPTPITLYL